jgi:hypothetical protein
LKDTEVVLVAKKKKKEESEDVVASYSLDSALKSSKKTETDLKGLLKTFIDEDDMIAPKKGLERKAPQLSHESKKKIAEAYVLEDVPITKRMKDTTVPPSEEVKKEIKVSKSAEETEVEESIPSPEKSIEQSVPATVKKPSFSKKDNIYVKLNEFFESMYEGYTDRYDKWENSVSSILTILRKMRKITKKNTEDLVVSINNMHSKIQESLEQFKIKRQEVEKIAGVDVQLMSSEFKKVLGLLELQVKEYQLKKLTDEYIHFYNLIS